MEGWEEERGEGKWRGGEEGDVNVLFPVNSYELPQLSGTSTHLNVLEGICFTH